MRRFFAIIMTNHGKDGDYRNGAGEGSRLRRQREAVSARVSAYGAVEPYNRCIRLLVELGRIDYEEAAVTIFAAQEWIASRDWSKTEEPSPVQVALAQVNLDKGARLTIKER